MSLMTSRERVLLAINREQPDRTPADIWAEPKVWKRLMRDLSVGSENEVRDHLNTDFRYISPVYPPDYIDAGVKQNMWGERWKLSNTPWGEDWEHTEGALVSATTLEELQAFPWPKSDDVDYSSVAHQCDEAEGFATVFGNADIFERPSLTRSWETFFVDMYENQNMVDFIIKTFLDFYIEDFHRVMEASGGRIDIYYALTDLGTQSGLLQSMNSFERFVAPQIRTLAGVVHREGVKFMYHTCGAVREAIPALIECGVDILNPIQPAAIGMEPEGLKRDFGDRLTFHGGIDIQFLLPIGTVDDVKAETKRRSEILGAGGGYIIAPSHNLQQDIPTENILAMYDISCR